MNGSEHFTETVDDLLSDGYRHDATRVPAVARVADAACEEVADPHDAALRVEALARRADPQVDRAAATALYHTFMYFIKVAPAQEQPDARLEPIEGPSLLPTALRDAGDDLRQLWLELADEVLHPVGRARCWDIVFTLQLTRNRRDSAERAARAYLDAAATTLSRQRKADGLLRAWTMTRLVGLANLNEEITTAMTALAAEAVTHREDPYAAITVLGALIARPPRGTLAPPPRRLTTW